MGGAAAGTYFVNPPPAVRTILEVAGFNSAALLKPKLSLAVPSMNRPNSKQAVDLVVLNQGT